MRLLLRVWPPRVFGYCPAPFAGVAVRSVIVERVSCSDDGRVVMSGGSGSAEYEKQTRIQAPNRTTNINATQKPQHTAAVYRVGPVCGKK